MNLNSMKLNPMNLNPMNMSPMNMSPMNLSLIHITLILIFTGVCCFESSFGYAQTSKEKVQTSKEKVQTSREKTQAPLAPNEARGRGGMVTADNSTASAVGVQVLREGGDAIDAAITTALMLGVLQPFASGVGGGGFAVVYRRTKKNAYTLDFREVAPRAAHRDMYLDAKKKVIPNLSTIGALAAGVPGELAGLYELHRRHGRLPWRRLVEPALKAARDGFPMHPLLYERTKAYMGRVKLSPTLSTALLDHRGQPKPIGEEVTFPDLAHTLAKVAEKGSDGFYRGEVAQELVRSIKKGGGIISLEDLAQYKPKERPVLRGSYLGYELLTMPPPSSGGVVILQALKVLESAPLQNLGHNSPLYLHHLTETLKHAFADRAKTMGDPDFYPVPLDQLLSSKRVKEIKATFNPQKTLSQDDYGGRYQPTKDGGTSHFNVIDQEGNAVAITTTINTGFGSRYVAGKTGVLMNNEMDDFISKPGTPNAYGLIGQLSNAIEPNKKPLSSMSPTIVLRGDVVKGMVGGSGGPTIITGTLQVLLNLIHFYGAKGAVGAAVTVPRVHHQWVPNTLKYDTELNDKSRIALLARGHKLSPWKKRFTSIQAIWVNHDMIYGASDPSKRGTPHVVSP